MTATTPAPAPDLQKRGGVQRLLDGIERIGNKVPHPAIIFAGLCLFVILLSAVLAAVGVSVTYEVAEPPVVDGVTEQYEGGSQVPDLQLPPEDYAAQDLVIHEETTEIESLLSIDGLRFLFTSLVSNFSGFSVVAVILVAMLGVGVAEESGLMGALIRKLVRIAPPWAITFIIVFVGMLSSIASDAGYLILIPPPTPE
jgi:aminobenzoyl-glutamate transport protein